MHYLPHRHKCDVYVLGKSKPQKQSELTVLLKLKKLHFFPTLFRFSVFRGSFGFYAHES